MPSNLNYIIDQVGKDKGIGRKVIIDALEQAVLTASRKTYGHQGEIEVHYNEEAGEVELFQFKQVVEEVMDPSTEISLEEARDLDAEAQIGDSLGVKLATDFGRIGAQTAKQVIIQKVREAERENVYNEFKDRKGDIVSGTVQRMEKGNLYVNVGRTEAVLLLKEQIPGEVYRQGDRLRAYILDIQKNSKGVQIFLSRTHPGFLSKLFENEVPEISEGVIKIISAAREPGERAKIAVYSSNRDVDPVGACVGMRGSRVQNVVQELRGERIDIIPWSQDQAKYICNALAPAKISRVYIDEEYRHMEVVVADDQLSLAIGKKGQNVRLASKLTGWKIDIKSESKMEKISGEIFEMFKQLPYIGDVTSRILYNEGFRSLKEIAEVDPEDLARILKIEKEKAVEIIQRAAEGFQEEGPESKKQEVLPPSDSAMGSVDRIDGVGEKTAEILKTNGFQTIQDLLKADIERLSSLPGIGLKKAEKLLQSAQRLIEEGKK
ncbi:MAG: transcription termination/antitermination protein NusA [Deltaproteobacteria bacterium RBG_16_48_10]|nr:MAG: transcription termination/antitermination protein NusA [Deltaproteobacteria bacterium RBG_16_48_10]